MCVTGAVPNFPTTEKHTSWKSLPLALTLIHTYAHPHECESIFPLSKPLLHGRQQSPIWTAYRTIGEQTLRKPPPQNSWKISMFSNLLTIFQTKFCVLKPWKHTPHSGNTRPVLQRTQSKWKLRTSSTTTVKLCWNWTVWRLGWNVAQWTAKTHAKPNGSSSMSRAKQRAERERC